MISITLTPDMCPLRRRQWRFEIRAGNGHLLSRRPSDASALLFGGEPVELVVRDRYGQVSERRRLGVSDD